MHSSHFIQDLAIVMLVAAFTSLLFRRLKQPVVLAYILAGMIVGPHTPPFSFVQDRAVIDTLASLGVIFLMFSLGLHFNLQKLRKVGISAFITAFFEILFMVWIGYELGQLFGWDDLNSIFLGGILAISSTTIIVKALEELGLIHEKFAELVFGILIVEDILAIALIALLSSVAQTGSLQWREIFDTLLNLGTFLTVLLVLGLLIVPPLLRWVDHFKNREAMLISVLGLCFGVSVLAIKLDYSEALGAFMIGAIIAETKNVMNVDSLVAPLRDMFSAIFFVSVGMMINPVQLKENWILILMIAGVVILGKIITCTFGTLLTGYDFRNSFKVGMSLAQIGEFSFIIATLGLSLRVIDSSMYPVAVMVSALTTLTTPYLIRSSDRVSAIFEKYSPPRLVKLINLYTSWLQRVLHESTQNESRKELRGALIQLCINLLLVTGIFIAANFSVEYIEQIWPTRPRWMTDMNPVCWAVAMFVSLPFLGASFLKFKVVGEHFASRFFSSQPLSNDKVEVVQMVFSNIFFAAGILAMGLWILILSSAMFTNVSTFTLLALLVILLGIIFRRLFTKVYSKAQGALMDNLSNP